MKVGIPGKLCLVLLLAAGSLFGQASARATAKATAGKKTSTVSSRLSQMEQAIAAQQQQIQQLENQLKSRDSQVQQLQQQLSTTQASVTQAQQAAQTAQEQAAKAVPAEQLDAVKRDVSDLQGSATNYALNLQETQKEMKGLESPLAIHYKGITVTPGGFLAAETVWRNRGLGADINTPFNSLNLPGAGQNRVSEFYGSGRQSRVALLAEGKLSDAKFSGYYEADFLSSGTTSNNNESNSYTLRQRQVWGQAAYHNWTFTGGQMWSLVTETKKGVDNRSEALPMTIDPQYTVGFSWARQFGFRVARSFNDKFWLAASIENPQTTLSERNNIGNFVVGSAGNSGGLYNAFNGTYSFNAAPDVIAKAVFEPGFGHYEIFGIFSRFRDRVYPCVEANGNPICTAGGATTSTGAFNSSRNAGGVGANARVTLFKQLDIGAHAVLGNGVGRYGTAGLPDVTSNVDGTLSPLRSYQTLGTIEWHKPRFDLYFNGGGEYIERHWQFDKLQNLAVGYGSPLFPTKGCYTETAPGTGGFSFGGLSSKTCQADTRVVIEGTAGFWYRIYNGPRGKLQLGPQYSYVTRNTWAGTGGAPHGIDNMVFTSFRYYLP